MTNGVDTDAREQVARIYERYASHVAAYALRRAGRADAADVMAETFLVAWRRRDTIPDEPNTLPWLYGVARRVLANQRRTHRRRGRLRDRLETEFVRHDVDTSAMDNLADFQQVSQALDKLSDDDAELLRLTSWEALNANEIASMMGIAPGTARQRISRARQRLRKQLTADGFEADIYMGTVADPRPEPGAGQRSGGNGEQREGNLYYVGGVHGGAVR